jgi:hypothetical protein
VNTFVLEPIEDFTFDKVKYYSVRGENNECSEFIDFLERMEDEAEYEDDMDDLFFWLEEIGMRYGAMDRFFRQEGLLSDTKALPPRAGIAASHGLAVSAIRLYCMKLSESVVILFNGGIKTTQKAQECPNVKRYFIEANQLTRRINELFHEKEIQWNDDYTDILYDRELMIEL